MTDFIQFCASHGYGYLYKDEIKVFEILSKLWEEYQNLNKIIKIKFTEDEYGDEAKKLGLPKYAYNDDAGFDLPTILLKKEQQQKFRIFPGDKVMLHTGLKLEFPKGYWGRIIHRSSTEQRHRLRIIEGVIDEGYRGEMLVQVHNLNTFPLDIEHGQKLAQLILCQTCNFTIEETDKLSESARGSSGFGSSGK